MPQLCVAYHFLFAYVSSDSGLAAAEDIPTGRQSMSGSYEQHTGVCHHSELWLYPRLMLMEGFLHYHVENLCVIKCLYT